MKFVVVKEADINLLLRKEEIGKFINAIMYYRYSINENKKAQFLENLQAIRIDEDKIVLIDGFGDICDTFERDGVVAIPKKYSDELYNEFQVVLSLYRDKFYLKELI